MRRVQLEDCIHLTWGKPEEGAVFCTIWHKPKMGEPPRDKRLLKELVLTPEKAEQLCQIFRITAEFHSDKSPASCLDVQEYDH